MIRRFVPLLTLAGCLNEAQYADGYSSGCQDGYRCACGGMICDLPTDAPEDDYGDGYATGYRACVQDGEQDLAADACDDG